MFQKLKTFVTGKDATGHSSGSFATPTTADSVLRTLTEIASELHARSVALEDALKHTDDSECLHCPRVDQLKFRFGLTQSMLDVLHNFTDG